MTDKIEPAVAGRALLFASVATWIEGDAVRQLQQAAERKGVTAVAGLPDLHPGRYGPVGSAILAEGVVHPDLIGTDIGCGMALFALDMPARRVKAEKAAERMRMIGEPWTDEALRAGHAAGSRTGHEAALGTVGGGNHFCELQAVHDIVDPEEAAAAGIEAGNSLLLVHTGSRSLGAAAFERHWNGSSSGSGLDAAGRDYLKDHDAALAFAALNRKLVAARAAEALRCDAAPLLDVPHNFAEALDGVVLHRKGAAPADRGLVPVPGSRGAFTYIVRPLAGDPRALRTIAHGAGRKHDRRWMESKAKHGRESHDRLIRNPIGSRVVCDDQKLAVEESHVAYKDIETVISDLEAFGLARVVAVTRPVVTFKSAGQGRDRR